jgi:hypothetical protein
MFISKLIVGIFASACLINLTACNRKIDYDQQEKNLKKYFAKNKMGNSPDYAIIKNGTDYIATIHGMADDLAVCQQIIKPYNENPSLSTFQGDYACVPLNH